MAPLMPPLVTVLCLPGLYCWGGGGAAYRWILIVNDTSVFQVFCTWLIGLRREGWEPLFNIVVTLNSKMLVLLPLLLLLSLLILLWLLLFLFFYILLLLSLLLLLLPPSSLRIVKSGPKGTERWVLEALPLYSLYEQKEYAEGEGRVIFPWILNAFWWGYDYYYYLYHHYHYHYYVGNFCALNWIPLFYIFSNVILHVLETVSCE